MMKQIDPLPPDVKTCSKCHQVLPLDAFAKGQYWCKACHKEYRVNHADEIYQRNKAYQEANRDKVHTWAKAFREKHADAESARHRAAYLAHKAKMAEKHRQWREKNPEAAARGWKRRKARVQQAKQDVVAATTALYIELIQESGSTCYYCGQLTSHPDVDHRVPLSRGGKHMRDNLVVACPSCNRRKGQRTDVEFFALLAQAEQREPLPSSSA